MKAKEIIDLLEANGWVEARQSGSHITFKKDGIPAVVTVPDHGNKDLAKGTLHSILKTSGLKK